MTRLFTAAKRKSKCGSSLAIVMVVGTAIVILAVALLPMVVYASNTVLSARQNRENYIFAKSSIEFAKMEVYNDVMNRSKAPSSFYLSYDEEDRSYVRLSSPDEEELASAVAQCAVERDSSGDTNGAYCYKVKLTALGERELTYETTCLMPTGKLLIVPESYLSKHALPLDDFFVVDGSYGTNDLWTVASDTEALFKYTVNDDNSYSMKTSEYNVAFKKTVIPFSMAGDQTNSAEIPVAAAEPEYPKIPERKTFVTEDSFTLKTTSYTYSGSEITADIETEIDNYTVYYNGNTQKPVNAGVYTVSVDCSGNTDYYDASGIVLGDITVDKLTPSLKAEIEGTGVSYITLKEVTANTQVYYGFSGTADGEITWQENRTFGGLTENTEYYFYVRAESDCNHCFSQSSAIKATTALPTNELRIGEYDESLSSDWDNSDSECTYMLIVKNYDVYYAVTFSQRNNGYRLSLEDVTDELTFIDNKPAYIVYSDTDFLSDSDYTRHLWTTEFSNSGWSVSAYDTDYSIRVTYNRRVNVSLSTTPSYFTSTVNGDGVLLSTPISWSTYYLRANGTNLTANTNMASGSTFMLLKVVDKDGNLISKQYTSNDDVPANESVALPDGYGSLSYSALISSQSVYSEAFNLSQTVEATVSADGYRVERVYCNAAEDLPENAGKYYVRADISKDGYTYCGIDMGIHTIKRAEQSVETSVEIAEISGNSIILDVPDGGCVLYGCQIEAQGDIYWQTSNSIDWLSRGSKYWLRFKVYADSNHILSNSGESEIFEFNPEDNNFMLKALSKDELDFGPKTGSVFLPGVVITECPSDIGPDSLTVYYKLEGTEYWERYISEPVSGEYRIGVTVSSNRYYFEYNLDNIIELDGVYKLEGIEAGVYNEADNRTYYPSAIAAPSIYFGASGRETPDTHTKACVNLKNSAIILRSDLVVFNSDVDNAGEHSHIILYPYDTGEGSTGNILVYFYQDTTLGDTIYKGARFYEIEGGKNLCTLAQEQADSCIVGKTNTHADGNVDSAVSGTVKEYFEDKIYPEIDLNIAYATQKQLDFIVSGETTGWCVDGVMTNHITGTAYNKYMVCMYAESFDSSSSFTYQANRVFLESGYGNTLECRKDVTFKLHYFELGCDTLRQDGGSFYLDGLPIDYIAETQTVIVKELSGHVFNSETTSDIYPMIQTDFIRNSNVYCSAPYIAQEGIYGCDHHTNLFGEGLPDQLAMVTFSTTELNGSAASTSKSQGYILCERYMAVNDDSVNGDVALDLASSASYSKRIYFYTNLLYFDVANINLQGSGGHHVYFSIAPQEAAYNNLTSLNGGVKDTTLAVGDVVIYFAQNTVITDACYKKRTGNNGSMTVVEVTDYNNILNKTGVADPTASRNSVTMPAGLYSVPSEVFVTNVTYNYSLLEIRAFYLAQLAENPDAYKIDYAASYGASYDAEGNLIGGGLAFDFGLSGHSESYITSPVFKGGAIS